MLKAAFQFGSWTILSRILGFLRDLLMAITIGAGMVSDAFIVAFRFPNLFRRFFAEGALLNAFIPIYVKRREHENTKSALEFASAVLSSLAVILMILSVVMIIIMPYVIGLIAPGFVDKPQQFDLTVMMARIMFFYLFFMALSALLSGVLNSIGKSWVMAMVPCLLNIIMLGALSYLYITPNLSITNIGYILSYSILGAGLLQMLVLYYYCRYYQCYLVIKRPFSDKDIKHLLWLMLPTMLSAGAIQINALVGDIIASFLTQGSISWLYYAERLQQLPIGLIGVALNIALLPAMSQSYQQKNLKTALEYQANALNIGLWLVLPAMIGLICLAPTIIRVLYGYGAFLEDDQQATAQALQIFAFGIPAAIMIKILQPSFFMQENTKTPLYITLSGVLVNITVALYLVDEWQFLAIAIANIVALGWQALCYYMILSQQKLCHIDKKNSILIAKSLFASLVMGGMILWLEPQLFLIGLHPIIAMIILIVFAMILYLFICNIIKGNQIKDIIQQIK
jgi:putative peptidoglycan lipid II flippase